MCDRYRFQIDIARAQRPSQDSSNEDEDFLRSDLCVGVSQSSSELSSTEHASVEECAPLPSPDYNTQMGLTNVDVSQLGEIFGLHYNSLLIIDTRPYNIFNTNRIISSIHISTAKVLLKKLESGRGQLEELFSEPYRSEFIRKIEQPNVTVFVLDENSLSFEGVASLETLLTALCKRCAQVRFLSGGYEAFRGAYPQFTQTLQRLSSSLSLSTSASFSTPLVLPTLPVSQGVTEVIDGLYLGSASDAEILDDLQQLGITHILNITADIDNFHEGTSNIVYKRIAINDQMKEELLGELEGGFDFIDNRLIPGNKVLVHCLAGVSRSATMVIAYLMSRQKKSLDEAYDFVKERRSIVSPNLGFMGQLRQFERSNGTKPCKFSLGRVPFSPLTPMSPYSPFSSS